MVLLLWIFLFALVFVILSWLSCMWRFVVILSLSHAVCWVRCSALLYNSWSCLLPYFEPDTINSEKMDFCRGSQQTLNKEPQSLNIISKHFKKYSISCFYTCFKVQLWKADWVSLVVCPWLLFQIVFDLAHRGSTWGFFKLWLILSCEPFSLFHHSVLRIDCFSVMTKWYG